MWLRLWPLEWFALALQDSFAESSRRLTGDELADASLVFGESLDPTPVRIVSTGVAYTPMALGNTIRIGLHGGIDRPTLIHELAHVWQYQTRGPSYISNSALHQTWSAMRTGSTLAAYEVTDEDLAATSIHDLPAEKQAMIVETWFSSESARRDPRHCRFVEEVRWSRRPNR